MANTLAVFLPDLGFAQSHNVIAANLAPNYRPRGRDGRNFATLEQELTATLAVDLEAIPWGRLRASQFKLSDQVQFACCVDPVLLHTTHRGVYLMGLADELLSHEQALRIVAELNQNLADSGEVYWMQDKGAWLFSSEQALELVSMPLPQLIGKDLFNYKYQGEQAAQWTARANEAQMLIHHLADYQQLLEIPPQYSIGLHFWSPLQPRIEQPIPFTGNENQMLISNEPLLADFCVQTMNHFSDAETAIDAPPTSDEATVYWKGKQLDSLASLLQSLLQGQTYYEIRIRYGDAEQSWQRQGFWTRLFSRAE